MMTREQAVRKRERLAAQLPSGMTALRGSLLQRTTRHSSGCAKCARGEGHPQWVLRRDQVPQVREAIATYRRCKQSLEAISELNQFLLRLDREQSRKAEKQS